MVSKNYKESWTLWQTPSEDAPVPECALVIEKYNDLISIEQEGNRIQINYGTIPELRKLLNQLKQE